MKATILWQDAPELRDSGDGTVGGLPSGRCRRMDGGENPSAGWQAGGYRQRSDEAGYDRCTGQEPNGHRNFNGDVTRFMNFVDFLVALTQTSCLNKRSQ